MAESVERDSATARHASAARRSVACSLATHDVGYGAGRCRPAASSNSAATMRTRIRCSARCEAALERSQEIQTCAAPDESRAQACSLASLPIPTAWKATSIRTHSNCSPKLALRLPSRCTRALFVTRQSKRWHCRAMASPESPLLLEAMVSGCMERLRQIRLGSTGLLEGRCGVSCHPQSAAFHHRHRRRWRGEFSAAV